MSIFLQLGCSATDTTIRLSDTSTFPTNGGVIQIESEQILYQRATDSTVVNCTRGYNSTSAIAHAQNKTVTVVSQTASNGTSNFDLSGTGAPTSTTGINQAFTGCRYTDLAAGNIYVNQGTLTVPNWILVEAGAGGGITQLTGDVTAGPGSGSQGATVVFVGGETAAAVANAVGQAAAALPTTGGTMSGSIDMGTFPIVDMADPTNPQDAATKNYVDIRTTPNLSFAAENVEYDNSTNGTYVELTGLVINFPGLSNSANTIEVGLSGLLQNAAIGNAGLQATIQINMDGGSIVPGGTFAALLSDGSSGTANLADNIHCVFFVQPGDTAPHQFKFYVGHANATGGVTSFGSGSVGSVSYAKEVH